MGVINIMAYVNHASQVSTVSLAISNVRTLAYNQNVILFLAIVLTAYKDIMV
jgi:hypothetical protein